jgi:hypothetical protein
LTETRSVPRHDHTSPDHARVAFWAWRGGALLLAAVVLYAAGSAIVGTKGARIYVRWSAGVDDAARGTLERQLGLAEGRVHEGATWTYAISDVSREHIAAIVKHPSVADTHKLDRQTFELAPDVERTPPHGGLVPAGDGAVALLNAATGVLTILSATALVIAALHRWQWHEPVASRLARVDQIAAHPSRSIGAAGRWLLGALQRGIPVIDAYTAGVFRVVFGMLLLTFLALNPVDASWLPSREAIQASGALHRVVLGWLAANPWFADRAWITALALGAAFTFGIATRWTFSAFVAVFLLWVAVYVAHRGSHTSTAISVALVALLPSRWGDGFSMDAALARRPTVEPGSGARYGYSVWVLSLVLGLCFAAAAWSKVKDGYGWVANGTVAFHFIIDSPQALVSWGLWVARSYPLAVALSLIAVLTEAFVITAAFTRRRWHRAAAGLAAFSLLAGFALFQGVIWPTWWFLLLGFLPWETFATRRVARPALASRPATLTQLAAAALLIGQQVIVSAIGVESALLFSSYDMYSATYASREAFDRTRPIVYRLVDVTHGNERELSCSIDDSFAGEFRKLAAEEPVDGNLLAAGLRECAVPMETPGRLALVGDQVEFDWQRGTLKTRRTTIVGPVSVSTIDAESLRGTPKRIER